VPALSAPRTRPIARLGDELRFAPRHALLAHIDNIEELAALADEEGVYPEDFVVFRVTGYRPEIERPELIGGEDLLGDLSALGERLCESARLRERDLDSFETIDELAARWRVSRKTIERYRRLGLVARRVDRGSGRRAIVFTPRAVELFESRHAQRLGRAASFTRVNDADRARVVRWARRYRGALGWSISRACDRIAQRLGRSRECVRAALAAHDESASDPIFARAARADERERRAMIERWMRGERPGTIGARFGRESRSVTREINRARHALILGSGVLDELAGGAPDDAALGASPVVEGLCVEPPRTLGALVSMMRRDAPAVVYEQTARAAAARTLAARCAQTAARIDHGAPSGRALDEIETAMRWIMLLRIALVRSQAALVLATLESRLGGRVETLGPARAGEILLDAIDAAYDSVRRYDPGGGGRLAARVGLALSRHASRLRDVAATAEPGKAGRGIGADAPAPDWPAHLWARWWWLRPQPTTLARLGTLDTQDRALIEARTGAHGQRPITLAELGERLGTTPLGARRIERGALRRLHTPGEP